jgi:Tfp pilus assembly protein PilZ
MRNVSVQFSSGREVLSSYWGFLDNGGLVLARDDLREGDRVLLDVRIKSLKKSYRIEGHVVRRADHGDRAFVAFKERAQQDLMLNAAWADTHDVPQRKHRRQQVTTPFENDVRYARVGDGGSASTRGQLLDVSPGGCRLRGDAVFAVGTRILILTDASRLEGQVRWTTPGNEMGIEFLRPDRVIEALLGR